MERRYFVYILSSRSRNLYIGVTNNLYRRTAQHRSKVFPGFTTRYNVNRLVYVECFDNIRIAIAREKQIKGWRRDKKLALITTTNPAWQDLAETWFPKQRQTPDPSLRSG
ncbi:MAG TPA: GIY-YIG nuclease family protein [Candidatus Binatia bacterium]|jgi:putative endonuclease|nr:GIY-YIG nuclease family protein [Candidatus Binatia bacterium]